MPTYTRRAVDSDRFRDLRERAQLSQSELARRCTDHGWPITPPAVNRIERGSRQHPYEQTLKACAAVLTEALGKPITVGDLLAEDEDAS